MTKNKYDFTFLAHRPTVPNTTHAAQRQMDDFIKHDLSAQMLPIMIYEPKAVSHAMKSNAK